MNKLLKLDPKNTELLTQKQNLLQESIQLTQERLKTLKTASEEAAKTAGNYDKWKAAYTPIQEEIVKTNQKLDALKKNMKDMEQTGDVNTEGYKKAQADVSELEAKLESLKQQKKHVDEEFERPISPESMDALNREIEETSLKLKGMKTDLESLNGGKTGSFLSSLGESAKGAAEKTKGLSAAAGGLIGTLAATVPATEELRSDLSKLDNNAQSAGVKIDSVREAFEKFNVVSDETDSSVEATSNLLQAGFTESNLQKAVEGLSGAYLRFPDTMKIESLADSLQETLATGAATGQFGELLDRLGIGAQNFTDKMATMSTEAEKQNYALETLANAGLIDSYNAWKSNNAALTESKQANLEFQQSMAELAEVMMPLVTKITEFATKIISSFSGLPSEVQESILVFLTLTAALSPFFSIVSKVSGGISALTGFFSKTTAAGKAVSGMLGILKTAFSTLFKVIMGHPVIAVITAIIAAILLLYNKCEWFRDGVDAILKAVGDFFKNLGKNIISMKDSAIQTFEKMKSGISTKVSSIRDTVKRGFQSAIDYITSLPGKAVKWGSDFIDGIARGIRGAIGKVTSAVRSVANKITSFLHFSRPDEGPLREYESWMPDFIDGLVNGIDKNIYKITDAMKRAAGAFRTGELNPMVAPAQQDIVVNFSNTTQIGNREFDSYIVKTAKKGISGKQQNISICKGYAYV